MLSIYNNSSTIFLLPLHPVQRFNIYLHILTSDDDTAKKVAELDDALSKTEKDHKKEILRLKQKVNDYQMQLEQLMKQKRKLHEQVAAHGANEQIGGSTSSGLPVYNITAEAAERQSSLMRSLQQGDAAVEKLKQDIASEQGDRAGKIAGAKNGGMF